jgi:hypothetical protein
MAKSMSPLVVAPTDGRRGLLRSAKADARSTLEQMVADEYEGEITDAAGQPFGPRIESMLSSLAAP